MGGSGDKGAGKKEAPCGSWAMSPERPRKEAWIVKEPRTPGLGVFWVCLLVPKAERRLTESCVGNLEFEIREGE